MHALTYIHMHTFMIKVTHACSLKSQGFYKACYKNRAETHFSSFLPISLPPEATTVDFSHGFFR